MTIFERSKLSTPRLDLIAATREHLDAERAGREHLARLLCAMVGPDWPPGEYDRDAREFFRTRLREEGISGMGWYLWYAIRRGEPGDPTSVVGAAGYMGPPDGEGRVEIGFSVLPSWRRMGFATEMARALIQNAFADDRVRKVIAHAASDNAASRRVLDNCGFIPVAMDEERGGYRYELAERGPSVP